VLYGCVLWFGFNIYRLRRKFKEIFQGQFSKIGLKLNLIISMKDNVSLIVKIMFKLKILC